jgi:hypothetical protein
MPYRRNQKLKNAVSIPHTTKISARRLRRRIERKSRMYLERISLNLVEEK